jgi:polyhydroxybutyrate depolymerase
VCYPEGIANSWNSGFQTPYNSSPDDVGFISKIIDTLADLYNINLNRVYACGMSNGGFQSYRLACDLENRIAAIASVTGNISTLTALNCVLDRHIPVLHIHGTQDPLVLYGGEPGYKSVEETINFFLTENQCSMIGDTVAYPNTNTTDSSTVERIHYASCGSGAEVMFYKITGGGHTWPNAYIDFIYGPTNRDFDASQEIWDFFNRFTLTGPTASEKVKEDLEVSIYPNPGNGNYELQITDYKPGEPSGLEVLDIAGRKIFAQQLTFSSTKINLSFLTKGVYFLKVEGKEQLFTRRIVKE